MGFLFILLFLSTFIILFFLPVQFRISYRKIKRDDNLVIEMNFLNGLVKRKREVSLLLPTSDGLKQKEEQSGRWFWLKSKEKKSSVADSRSLRDFLHRYRHFGLGMTLLTYMVPAKYHRWLLVADNLENRGYFQRFSWVTRLGTGNVGTNAILYGLAWGLKSGIVGYLSSKYQFRQPPEIEVIPDYYDISFDTVFDCIFRVKLGYIIIAAFTDRFRHRILKGGVSID
ncbi:MAG TPA: DUF2953 domain-containing protein [Bacillota bacterium]|nr:DUF2953 domain-containing protein [Bacillota bacterium]HOL09332.1 DUF2953 domain-containing protein [Bacillota bacterium]HPO97637.1 DUF2953 domain-containing protein [Bacillota bacterium]